AACAPTRRGAAIRSSTTLPISTTAIPWSSARNTARSSGAIRKSTCSAVAAAPIIATSSRSAWPARSRPRSHEILVGATGRSPHRSAPTGESIAEQRAAGCEALRGPVSVAVVVLFDRGHPRGKDHPRLLRRREDMDIRWQAIRFVEGADANEPHGIAGPGVIAPYRDTAMGTARDLLSLSAV